MRYLSCFLLTVFLFSVPAGAAVYEWTDEKGVVNFTDNPENIPAKYRNKARKRPSITSEPSTSAPAQVQQPAESPQAVEPTPPSAKDVLYGGYDEQWWRSSYSSLRNEIKVIQDGLPAKREDLAAARRRFTRFTFPQNRKAYFDVMTEIEKDEARILELNKQLEALDLQAARAGVPFDWRR